MITRVSALAVCAALLAGCAEEKPIPQIDYAQVSEKAEVREISVIDLAAKITANEVVLIDVSDPAEFAAARIAGALNAPMADFNPAMIAREERRETIFYCTNGQRSAQAAEQFAAQYGGTVRHLAGGIDAWRDSGRLPFAQPSEAHADPDPAAPTPEIPDSEA